MPSHSGTSVCWSWCSLCFCWLIGPEKLFLFSKTLRRLKFLQMRWGRIYAKLGNHSLEMSEKQTGWKYTLHCYLLRPWGGMGGLPQYFFGFSMAVSSQAISTGYLPGDFTQRLHLSTSICQPHSFQVYANTVPPRTFGLTLIFPIIPLKHLKASQLWHGLGSSFRLLYCDNLPFTFTFAHGPGL